MTESTETAVAPQLPERFVERLQDLIPETSDSQLYQLIEADPFSQTVFDRLNVHFEGFGQRANSLDGLHKYTKLRDLLQEWIPAYDAALKARQQ